MRRPTCQFRVSKPVISLERPEKKDLISVPRACDWSSDAYQGARCRGDIGEPDANCLDCSSQPADLLPTTLQIFPPQSKPVSFTRERISENYGRRLVKPSFDIKYSGPRNP